MLFIESIKYHQYHFTNLAYHQQRLECTRKHFFPQDSPINLKNVLIHHTPGDSNLYKCRVIYGKQIYRVEFVPYKPRRVSSLKIVYDDTIDYSYKYQDREPLDILFKQKGVADDILVIKNGNITDSYYANIAFSDGKRWYTPASPLLKGTKRASLLNQKIIEEAEITLRDLFKFKSIKLLNAMLDWDSPYEISMDYVF